MKCFYGGGFYGAFLLFSLSVHGQVSVLNGLSHFQPCSDARTGEIWIQNEGDSTLSVLLEKHLSLGHPEELTLTSEVLLAGHERRAIPFHWEVSDSLARHAEVLLYALPAPTKAPTNSWTVRTEIRYLLNLYTGCLEDTPAHALAIVQDNGLACTYTGEKIWKATAQSIGVLGQALDGGQPLFFYPGKTRHFQPVASCSYILIEDEQGQAIGIPWKPHAD